MTMALKVQISAIPSLRRFSLRRADVSPAVPPSGKNNQIADARLRGESFELFVMDAASVVVVMTKDTVSGLAPSISVDCENEQELAAGAPDEQESETGPLNVSSVLVKVSVKVAACPALIVTLAGAADSLIRGRRLTVVLSVAVLSLGVGSVWSPETVAVFVIFP
jgi:hypothetical protein